MFTQAPHALLSPHREASYPDQRPSAIASDLVSFSGTENDPLDDSMSSVASDAEDLSGSTNDPASLAMSALAGRVYTLTGQAASALHSMAILQVFKTKLLRCMDESGPDPAGFKELYSATELALRGTNTTAQAIGRSMAN